MKSRFFVPFMIAAAMLSSYIFAQEASGDFAGNSASVSDGGEELTNVLANLAAAITKGDEVAEKYLPPFDPGKDVCYLVVDGGEVNTEGRFNIGVQVYNYSSDKNINAEAYGYGGKFSDEWHFIHSVSMNRFNMTPKLFHPVGKYDYTHYRYFAIKITKPKNKQYQIVSDQQNDSLNFYIWDVGANSTASAALVGSSLNVAPKVYVIDPQELAGSDKNNLFIDSVEDFLKMPINLYVYSKKRQILVFYGSLTFEGYVNRQKMKRATQMSLEDFQMNSYSLSIDKNGMNFIVLDNKN